MNGYNQNKICFFQANLIGWYFLNGRKFPWRNRSSNNYLKIISEVLLKRTTAKSASQIVVKFVKKYSSWKKLSLASHKDVRDVLVPIGLYNQRAKDLLLLSQAISLRNGRFPKERKSIIKLPGVGRYVANAVLLFCFKQKVPLIDSNMIRVLQRYFGIEVHDYQKLIRKLKMLQILFFKSLIR